MGKNRELRTGNQTKTIYPRVALALDVLRERHFLRHAEEATGMAKESIAVCIRNVEKKYGVRLFDRLRGRGHNEWLPILTEETSAVWSAIKKLGVEQ